MRRRLLLISVLAVWLAILALIFQPHTAHAPVILHTHPLDHPDRNLPTIGLP
jgi:hypothetical protein